MSEQNRLDWKKQYLGNQKFILRVNTTCDGFVVEYKDLRTFEATQLFPLLGCMNKDPYLAVAKANYIFGRINKNMFKVIESKTTPNNTYWIFEAKENIFIPEKS